MAIGTVAEQESVDAARTPWQSIADQLRDKFPKLGTLMDDAENDVLAFTTFPRAHCAQIYSTNPLERLDAEIKRRTNVVGIFPNDASITRFVGAVLLEQNDECSLNRRCMQLQSLQTLSDLRALSYPQWLAQYRAAQPHQGCGLTPRNGTRPSTAPERVELSGSEQRPAGVRHVGFCLNAGRAPELHPCSRSLKTKMPRSSGASLSRLGRAIYAAYKGRLLVVEATA